MINLAEFQVNIALEKTIADLIDIHGAQKIVNTALAIQANRARKAENEYHKQRDALREASRPTAEASCIQGLRNVIQEDTKND